MCPGTIARTHDSRTTAVVTYQVALLQNIQKIIGMNLSVEVTSTQMQSHRKYQSIKQSVNQPINKTINQSIDKWCPAGS